VRPGARAECGGVRGRPDSGRFQSADLIVGLAAQTQPGGCVEGCQGEGESSEDVASGIDVERKGGERQRGEHEADELGESRRPSVLQLSRRSDARPDDPGEDLRPQGPLKTHERGEREHGDLGGEHAET